MLYRNISNLHCLQQHPVIACVHGIPNYNLSMFKIQASPPQVDQYQVFLLAVSLTFGLVFLTFGYIERLRFIKRLLIPVTVYMLVTIPI